MKIVLIGYGKMGKAIEEISVSRKHVVVQKISSGNKNELTKENLRLADVAIEFTSPDNAVENIIACLEAGIPVVSGTTGWLQHYDYRISIGPGVFIISASLLLFVQLANKTQKIINNLPFIDIMCEHVFLILAFVFFVLVLI